MVGLLSERFTSLNLSKLRPKDNIVIHKNISGFEFTQKDELLDDLSAWMENCTKQLNKQQRCL